MHSMDSFIAEHEFDARLETDLYLPDLLACLGQTPIEMERVGLGPWIVTPVNINDMGYVLLSVPKADQDTMGTTVFFQTKGELTNALIAGILLRLLCRDTARFMTPEGDMITPEFPTYEPSVDSVASYGLLEH